jgi:hypothetical protein
MYRSIRASWSTVKVSIDGSSDTELKQSTPTFIDLNPGTHEIRAQGNGFNSADFELKIDGSTSPVIVISPLYRDGASRTTPLGTLVIHEESDLRGLQPYAFYKRLPTSFGIEGVLHSVIISMLFSVALSLAGIALLLLIPVEFVTQGAVAGFFVLVLGVFVSSIVLPAGIGGILIDLRFLRLPPRWRNPSNVA